MENLVHSAVESAVNRGDRYVGLYQLRVFDIVGALLPQRRPGDFRIDDKGGARTFRIEHSRVR